VSDLKKKLMINYNKLIIKKKDQSEDQQINKQQVVQDSLNLIKDNFEDLIFKHDGCRIVQALIKHGSSNQKTLIIDAIKSHTVKLMTQKYSNHLAQKAYYYAPKEEQKKYFRT
jgi:hypothetical protein